MIVKFNMSSGDSFTMPKEQAEKIINSPVQLVMVSDVNGSWSGKTINKAHIVSTSIDEEASRLEDLPDFNTLRLNPQNENERISSLQETLKNKRQELIDKGILKH